MTGPEPQSRRGAVARFFQFLRDVRNELRKVTWPTFDELKKAQTVIVIRSDDRPRAAVPARRRRALLSIPPRRAQRVAEGDMADVRRAEESDNRDRDPI